jgi:hypothetical protein
MPFIEDGSWIVESEATPVDKNLWNQAKRIALLDKQYSAHNARIVQRRVYQMMGGSWKPKKSRKKK